MASSNLLFSERLKDFTNEENKRNKAKEEAENKKIEKKLKKRQMGGENKSKKYKVKEAAGAAGAAEAEEEEEDAYNIDFDWQEEFGQENKSDSTRKNSTKLKTWMTKTLINGHFVKSEMYKNTYNKKFIELYSNIIIEMYKKKENVKLIKNEDIKKLIIQYFVLRNIEESSEFKLKDFNDEESQVIKKLRNNFEAMSTDDFKKKFDLMTDYLFLKKKFKKN